MSDAITELYEKYNILSQAKDVSQHSQEYSHCIAGTKRSNKEKQLAAQIISKYFKYFPQLQEKAITAIIDLCECDEASIRISAIKVLPMFCKDSKENLKRVVDILPQLQQLEDTKDLIVATNCLIQVYKEDPVITLRSIFNFIHTTDDMDSREKNVQCVYKRIVKMEDKLTPEINDMLINEGKKIIQESSATEFLVVIPFLIASKLTKTSIGQQELVDLVAERAEIDQDYDPLDDENLNSDRIIMCVESILSLFNAHVPSTKFIKFYCNQVLPKWESISKLKNGDVIQHQFLKQLAELSTHCGSLEEPQLLVKQIFELLKKYMPLPPEDVDINEMPNLDFTTVECLLYTFHRLARQCPEFLTANPAVLKDFRARLTYFSRGVGGCKKSLGKIQVKNKDDEKIKIAPAVLDNISSLIKDLFYTTPVYKCNIHLSFKSLDNKIKLSPEKPTTTTVAQKRHAPIHYDSSNGSSTKQVRSTKGTDNVKLYTPPSGKFSNSFQSYDPRSGPRGRGRGGRGIRGIRGSSRGWRN